MVLQSRDSTRRAPHFSMSNAVRRRVIIVGAAGRDFHNFIVVYRTDRQLRIARAAVRAAHALLLI
jgi:hypothetical protein